MPARRLTPTYAAPQVTDPYYGDYSALAQQLAANQGAYPPVYSTGQGLANVIGDVGKAYFDRQALQKAKQQENKDYSDVAMAQQLASDPNLQKDNAPGATPMNVQGGMASPVTMNPNQQPGMPVPGDPGMKYGQVSIPSDMVDTSPMNSQDRYQTALKALSGVNPKMAIQAAPGLAQMAQQFAPKILPALKPGEILPQQDANGKITTALSAPASAESVIGKAASDLRNGLITQDEYNRISAKDTRIEPREPKNLQTVTTDQGIYILNGDGTLGTKLGNAPARERNPKMQTYYDENGTQVQLDSNDPEDQKIIKAKGLVSESPSDTQRAAKGYLDRMTAATGELQHVVDSGFVPGNAVDKYKSSVPLIGNALQSDNSQLYTQAQQDWVRAKLRKESGAVIGKDEMQQEIDTYFPKPGDSQATKDQKLAARKQAERQMATGAGILGRGQLRALDQPASPDANDPPPNGVDPGLWAHATPEERALWKK